MAINGTTGLHRKIAQTEQKVNKLQFELAVEKAVLTRLRAAAHDESPPLLSSGTTQAAGPKIIPGTITQYIVDTLQDNKNKPMRVRDITASLKARGVTTVSPRGLMPMIISTMRRRTGIFERLERGVYRLVNFTQDEPSKGDTP